MNAHELARRLLEGPDVPVISAFGEFSDHDEITEIEVWPENGKWPRSYWCSSGGGFKSTPAVELR